MLIPDTREGMTGKQLEQWAVEHNFTWQEAADALGIGRTSFWKYIKMDEIPRVVHLAIKGYEFELFYRRSSGRYHHKG